MDTFESFPPGVPANACDDAQANGFVKCDGGVLHRHCSPRNRDGGMYDSSGLGWAPPSPPDQDVSQDVVDELVQLGTALSPPPAGPAPLPPPPEFSSQPEGMLFFGGCILIFMLLVCFVRASLSPPCIFRRLLAPPCFSC